jgi:hypothetical protein
MTDITTQLRARRVTRWIHATGETPVAAGFAHDTLCGLAADEIERLREALLMCSTAGDGLTLAQEVQIRAALKGTK